MHTTCCLLYNSCFKRYSRAALNRQQELSHLPMPPQLRLYDYLQKRKERKPTPVVDLKISKMGNVSGLHYHSLFTLEWRSQYKFPNVLQLCPSVSLTRCESLWIKKKPTFLFSLLLFLRPSNTHHLQCVDTWKQSNCQLTVPKEIDVSSKVPQYNISFTRLNESYLKPTNFLVWNAPSWFGYMLN